MSRFYGIINLNQSAVPGSMIDGMKSCLDSSSSDMPVWNHKNFAGGIEGTMPEEDPRMLIQIVASGRLYNRADLFEKLDPGKALPDTTDQELIVLSYRKWGKDCVHYLMGEWILVAWDHHLQELFAARDATGHTNIFYTFEYPFFAFASSIKALRSLPFMTSDLNDIKLASVLTTCPCETEQTVFEKISLLPPGHLLILKHNILFIERYWQPEHTPMLHLPDEKQYFEKFLELYAEVMRSTLEGFSSPAVALSSGFDSGSVAALAAMVLGNAGRELQTFTSVPQYDAESVHSGNRLYDESTLVREYSAMYSNIRQEMISAADVSVLEGLDLMLELFSEPVMAFANFYWMNELVRTAAEKKADILLTGQSGNFTVSWPVGRYATNISPTPFRKLKRNIRESLPDALMNTYLRMRNGSVPLKSTSMISPGYARKIGLAQHIRSAGWYPHHLYISGMHEAQVRFLRPRFFNPGRLYADLATRYGLATADPTHDRRIVEFCFSLPDHIYTNKDSSRRLIRDAFKGRMPEAILSNPRRGQQSADLLLRLHHQQDELNAFRQRIKTSGIAGEYLNVSKILHFIDAVRTLNGVRHQDVYGFMRAAAVFRFLEKL